MRRLSALGLALTLTACAQPAAMAPAAKAPAAVAAKAGRNLAAGVLRPDAVDPAVLASTLSGAQQAADEASRRRKIDFFHLHAAPVGLRVGQGEGAGYVLSYVGTSKQRTDLNIELRALYAPGQLGFSHNYSGPVTLAAAGASKPALRRARGGAVAFELLMGVPGNGVDVAYGDYLEHLQDHLRARYQARPFSFDDGPLIFAVHEGDAVTGFVFTNQGNRLVLGDRKYADVQSVVHVSAEAEVLAAYTLIGFNEKTASPTSAPDYRFTADQRYGLFAEFGEL